MKKCPLCHGVGKRPAPVGWRRTTPTGCAYLSGGDLIGCRFCNMLGYVDEQIRVTYALDRELAYEMAKERRAGDKAIRIIGG